MQHESAEQRDDVPQFALAPSASDRELLEQPLKGDDIVRNLTTDNKFVSSVSAHASDHQL